MVTGSVMGVTDFGTVAVKIDFDIAEDAMISRLLILQSDHKGRLQTTKVVRVFLKFSGVLIDPKHAINWVMIKDVLGLPLPPAPGMDI